LGRENRNQRPKCRKSSSVLYDALPGRGFCWTLALRRAVRANGDHLFDAVAERFFVGHGI
jgi:hypothetical protein